MIITQELCSVCRRPPGSRIAYRNGELIVCNRFCAKDSIGLVRWNEWWEIECSHRLKTVTKHNNVKQFKVKL